VPHPRALLCLLCALALAGCGFQLRGSTNIPFKTLYIGVADTSPIAVELKRSIRGNGPTRIVTDPAQAEAKLEVLHERATSDIETINSVGIATEYHLYYNIEFRVTNNKGRIFIPPTQIRLKRLILTNNNAVLAENFQIVDLLADMQSDAAQQMLRRMEAIKPDGPPVNATED
jgi:LPS-assembly lipoprotein